ncbi:MAG: helix-hairpin-helix domain-containing protein [Cytophagales bacterium]
MSLIGKIKVSGLVIFLILNSGKIAAQETIDFEQFLHDLLPLEDERAENLDFYDQLLLIYQNPIDLNKAGSKELEQLYLLSQAQIQNIINYRLEFGNFLSLYELQAVPSIEPELIDKLKYFVEVKSTNVDGRNFAKRLKTSDRHYFLSRIERQIETSEGYRKTEEKQGFLGDPNKYLMRYRIARYGDYSMGFTFENDAGEEFKLDPARKQMGFDYASAHLYRENIGLMSKIALGDYRLQFGQGLIFASGFGSGKSAQTILSTKRISTGISPYSSVMESGFQRGIAGSFLINKILISPFYSRQNIDASIFESDSFNTSQITSISTSGIHNTETYYTRRKTSLEQVFGCNMSWTKKSSQLALTYAQQIFEHNYKSQELLRNKYKFNGRINHNIGIDYDINFLNMNLFGESAISSSGGIALVQGLITALNSSTDLAFHFRHFDKNFHTIRGSTFSEGTHPINESGFYSGISKKFGRNWKLNGYYDLFSFPWISYLAKAPSKGNELLLRLERRISRNSSIYLQYKTEKKEINAHSDKTAKLFERNNSEWILQLTQSLNEFISLRTRIQKKQIITLDRSEGAAFTQDLRLEYKRLRTDFRIAIFNSSDYQSRMYVLEKDVLYSLSAPAYFGKGIRNYILIKYKAGNKFDLWFKWARTLRNDVESIGTGLDRTEGNRRNTLKFQLIAKL